MTLGHVWLVDNIGVKPIQAWSVDPFGLSSTLTSLYWMAGFEYHAFRRIPQYQKIEWALEKKLNFYWKGSKSLPDSQLFSRAFYGSYNNIFNWEGSTKPVTEHNIVEMALEMIGEIEIRLKSQINKNHQLFLLGHDFTYQHPNVQYNNMTMLINYINKNFHNKFNLFYSSVSEYFEKTLSGIEKEKWPVYKDDFFVYSDNDRSMWSGYFVSYPTIKLAARLGERVLRRSEFLFSLSNIEKTIDFDQHKEVFSELFNIRNRLGLFSHHDTITGTSAEYVRRDEINKLFDSIEGANKISNIMLSSIVSQERFKSDGNFLNYNKFIEITPNTNRVPIIIFNSLGWTVDVISNVTINTRDVEVYNENGKKVNSFVKEIVGKENVFLLEFEVLKVPPIGFLNYEIRPKKRLFNEEDKKYQNFQSFTFENEFYKIEFSNSTKRLSKVFNKKSNIFVNVDMYFSEYHSKFENKKNSNSGAYVFRPAEKKIPSPFEVIESSVVESEFFVEIFQKFSNYTSVIIRLYKSCSTSFSEFVEFEVTSGVLLEDREVIFAFQTNINNERVVYTDENGYEMRKRSHHTAIEEQISSNFYPMVYNSFIRDNDVQFTVLTQKSQSFSSNRNGLIEMMIHRRTSHPDHRGCGEPVKDEDIVTFKMRVQVENPNEFAARKRHFHNYLLNFPVDVFVTDKKYWNDEKYPADYQIKYDPINPMPENIHFLSFNKVRRDENDIVVRFAQIFEVEEDEEFSKPVKLNVNNIFKKFNIKNEQQKSLSLLHDLQWSDTINPIEIKTVQCLFTKKLK